MSRFYDFLAPILGAGSAGALLLALIFLLRGALRKYWIIAAYVVWELFAAVALTVADVVLHGSSAEAAHSAANQLYARLYWTNDVIEDLFRFVLVIVLIYWSSGGAKRVSGRLLTILLLLMIVLPFVIFNPQANPLEIDGIHFLFPSSAWFNSTSELLNFGAAIMNLILWAALIASRRRDPQLLAVSAGLGVLVAGTALAYGLRHLTGPNPTQFGAVAALFLNLTQLAGFSIWCWAFRPAPGPQPVSKAVSSS
ncbi:MAG TPA: hypothetical protein VMB85_25865 [Bryobacteraceae bacterium]|nr:hypothetical protein [Bryobacteraceae bacterium]